MKKENITQEQFESDFNKLSVSDFKKKYEKYFDNKDFNDQKQGVSNVYTPTHTTAEIDSTIINQPAYQPANMGWICPKCGAVHAPWVQSCPNCSTPYRTNIVWATDKTPVSGDPNFGRGQTISSNGYTIQAGGSVSCTAGDPNQRLDVTYTHGKIYDPRVDFAGRPVFD